MADKSEAVPKLTKMVEKVEKNSQKMVEKGQIGNFTKFLLTFSMVELKLDQEDWEFWDLGL